MRQKDPGRYSSIPVQELVELCAVSDDIEAWEEFVRRFHRFIATVVIRVTARYGDSSRQTADDLIQETYLRLCANDHKFLREFDHRHPNAFAGYVGVIAANAVHDHFKSSLSQKRGGSAVESTTEVSELEIAAGGSNSPSVIERAVLIEEIGRHLRHCCREEEGPRNSRIFWLYYRSGLSASAIAALPGINLTTKGVESIILRMTKELRRRILGKSQERPGRVDRTFEGTQS